MSYIEEYEELGLNPRWLDLKKAHNAFDYSSKFQRSDYYGLNPDTVNHIVRLMIGDASEANRWLADKLSAGGTLQVIYSSEEVCVLPTDEFLNNWENILVPSRDDVLILDNLSKGILFFFHENEFEFGQRAV